VFAGERLMWQRCMTSRTARPEARNSSMSMRWHVAGELHELAPAPASMKAAATLDQKCQAGLKRQ
jgi:hypothetical protein